MTGMIEWAQQSKPKKSPGLTWARASKKKKKSKIKSLEQNTMTNFRSNFNKALNDITRKIETLVMETLCLVVIVKTLETLKSIFCYKHALWTMLLYSRNYVNRILGNYHESSDCFKYPQNSYLIKLPKKLFAKIFLLTKIPKSEISDPKKSFDHLCHLKAGVPRSGGFSPGTPKNPPTFPNSNSTRNIW